MKTLLTSIALACLLFAGCRDEESVKKELYDPPPATNTEKHVDPPPPVVPPIDPATATATNTPATNSPKPAVNVDQLIKQLDSADRQAAAVSLAAAGKSAVPALTKALDHKDWQVRAAAVFALGQIGRAAADAKAKLQTIAEKDENTSVRDAAAFAIDAIAE